MATKKSAPLDPKVADKLLELLSTDNEFRRLFKKDPAAALARAGHKEATSVIAGCLQVERIAPKADIIKARTELKSMLCSALGQSPPALEAATTAPRRARK